MYTIEKDLKNIIDLNYLNKLSEDEVRLLKQYMVISSNGRIVVVDRVWFIKFFDDGEFYYEEINYKLNTDTILPFSQQCQIITELPSKLPLNGEILTDNYRFLFNIKSIWVCEVLKTTH